MQIDMPTYAVHLLWVVFYADLTSILQLVTYYKWSSMQIDMPIYAVHLLQVVFYADLTSILQLVTLYRVVSHTEWHVTYAVHLLQVVFYADLTSLLELITQYLILSHCEQSTSKKTNQIAQCDQSRDKTQKPWGHKGQIHFCVWSCVGFAQDITILPPVDKA